MEKRTPQPVGSEELKDAVLAMMVERFGDRPLDGHRASTKVPCTGPGDWTASRCRATGCRSRGTRLPFPSAGMTP